MEFPGLHQVDVADVKTRWRELTVVGCLRGGNSLADFGDIRVTIVVPAKFKNLGNTRRLRFAQVFCKCRVRWEVVASSRLHTHFRFNREPPQLSNERNEMSDNQVG